MYIPTAPYAFGGQYRFIHDLYNIRPDRASDYRFQKMLGGLFEPYKNYMEGKTYDALAKENMDKLGVNWNDIKYPWAASLSGGNTAQAVGSGVSKVSDSIYEMYKSDPFDRKNAWKRKATRQYDWH